MSYQALEGETIESQRDTDRNLNDKFYTIRFEVEGELKALEKEKKNWKTDSDGN